MWENSHTFQPLSASFREEFCKEKYNNGYLCDRCAIIELNTNIKIVNKFKKLSRVL
jgi:hypothetical protein